MSPSATKPRVRVCVVHVYLLAALSWQNSNGRTSLKVNYIVTGSESEHGDVIHGNVFRITVPLRWIQLMTSPPPPLIWKGCWTSIHVTTESSWFSRDVSVMIYKWDSKCPYVNTLFQENRNPWVVFDANFLVLRCHQWQQNCHHENSRVLVTVRYRIVDFLRISLRLLWIQIMRRVVSFCIIHTTVALFMVVPYVIHVKYEVITWKRFPYYWPFVREIHRPVVDSPHKGPILRSFNVFFVLSLNPLCDKQSCGRWFETSVIFTQVFCCRRYNALDFIISLTS